MLDLAALLFMTSAVAFASQPRTWLQRAAAVGALTACGACLSARFSPWVGLSVGVSLAMAATTLLVLLLPPHPRWASPLALASASAALALGVLGWTVP